MKTKKEIKTIDLSNEKEIIQFTNNMQNETDPVVIKIKEKNNELSLGVALPRNHPSSMAYLKESRDYNDSSKNIYDQFELCQKLYIWEGIIGTVIDKFVDVSFSEFKIEGIKENSQEYKLLDYYCKNVNKGNNNITTGINPLSKSIAFEYYIYGNVFVYSKWNNVVIKGLKGKNKYKIPSSQVILNPKIIDIPRESIQFGNKVMKITLDRLFNGKILTSNERSKIIDLLPTRIRNKVKNNYDIVLDPYYTYHIKRKGSMYSGWGIPYLTRTFSAVAAKKRLRALDDSTIDGMINSITIFKVGDKDVKETWDASRLTAFANLISSPTASMTLVWSWDLDHIHISPSGDILNFDQRYKDANRDIIYALGLPLSILTSEGDKAGDVWASILFMIETLEDQKAEYKAFVEDSLNKILKENGFDTEVSIRFIKPRLNKDDVKNIVFALYDRGLLSKQTTLEESGYDKNSEKERRKAEKEEKLDDIMLRPDTPFSSKPGGSGLPNPQTQTNIDRKNNVKKDSKITQVNTKEQKTAPRMKGNVSDRIIDIMEYAYDYSEDTKNKQFFINFVDSLSLFSDNEIFSTIGTSIDNIKSVLEKVFENKSDSDIFSSKEEFVKKLNRILLKESL